MVTARTGEEAALTTTVTKIFEDPAGCSDFSIFVATGGNDCLVHIDGIHGGRVHDGDAEFFRIPAGATQVFSKSSFGIRKVEVKSQTGTVSIFWGVTGTQI